MHLNMLKRGRPCFGTALPRQCGMVGFAGHYRGSQPTVFDHGTILYLRFAFRNNDRSMRRLFVYGTGNNQRRHGSFSQNMTLCLPACFQ
jgi:hypothetical protein